MIARKTLAVLTLAILAGMGGKLTAQEPPVEATENPTTTTEDPAAEASAPPTAEPADKPIYTSRRARDQALLARALPEEVRWLELPSGQQLALYKPAEARTTRGALLIIQGHMEPPGWHPIMDNPRQGLPRHGWATLALNLPAPTPAAPPPRPLEPSVEQSQTVPAEEQQPEERQPVEDQPPAAEQPASSQVPSPDPAPPAAAVEVQPSREELIDQSLEAAFTWLAEENLSPVVLMLDASLALEILAVLEARPEAAPSALVLVHLQSHRTFSLSELETLYSNPALPVLDVFVTSELARLTDVRQKHKGVALRQQLAHYRQLELPESPPLALRDASSAWVEQVRGFMQRKPPKQ